MSFSCFNMFVVILALENACTDKRRRCQWAGLVAAVWVTSLLGTIVNLTMGGDATTTTTAAAADGDIATTTTDIVVTASPSLLVAATSVVNILEWVNSMLLLAFVVYFTWAKLAQFDRVALAITYTEKDPTRVREVVAAMRAERQWRGWAAKTTALAYVVDGEQVHQQEDQEQKGRKNFAEGNAESAPLVVVTAQLVKE
jgi:hypothetical protein